MMCERFAWGALAFVIFAVALSAPAAAELYIRPTVANAAAYTSERWGIRIPLPAPNALCGTAGQTDRGASAYLFVDDIDLCGSGGRFDDILLRVSIRSNLSGFEEFRTPPPPPKRAQHSNGFWRASDCVLSSYEPDIPHR